MSRKQVINILVGAWSLFYALFVFWVLCGVAGIRWNPIFVAGMSPAATAYAMAKYLFSVGLMALVHIYMQRVLVNNRLGPEATTAEKRWDTATSLLPVVVVLISFLIAGRWYYWHWMAAAFILFSVWIDIEEWLRTAKNKRVR